MTVFGAMRENGLVSGEVAKVADFIAELGRQLRVKENEISGLHRVLLARENELRDLKEVLEDKRRVTRELDVALNGEEGAAQQASLIDLIGPAQDLRRERDQLQEEADYITSAIRNFYGYDISVRKLIELTNELKLFWQSANVLAETNGEVAEMVRTYREKYHFP